MGKENDVDIVGRMNQLVWLVLGGLAGLSHPLDLGKRFVQDLTTATATIIQCRWRWAVWLGTHTQIYIWENKGLLVNPF